jgi:hypothetical protein
MGAVDEEAELNAVVIIEVPSSVDLFSDKRRAPQIDQRETPQHPEVLDALAIDERHIGQVEHNDVARIAIGKRAFEFGDPWSRQAACRPNRGGARLVSGKFDSQHVLPSPSEGKRAARPVR